MKTHDIIEMYDAQALHITSHQWILELEFIKDEHLFFEDLVKSFTLQLIDSKSYEEHSEIIKAINASEKHNDLLLKAIKGHDKNLKSMVEGKLKPNEELAYKMEHKKFMEELNAYLKAYKSLKMRLFTLMKGVFKKEKQKRLLA